MYKEIAMKKIRNTSGEKPAKSRIRAGFFFLTLLLAFGLSACGSKTNIQEYSRTFLAMDTIMSITLYGEDEESLAAAADAIEAEVNRLDSLLSTGSSESEISKLNAAGGGSVSEDTAYLLKRSLEIYASTDGAFDISIYPVMRAWGFTDQNFRLPSEEELAKLLPLVNASAIYFDSESQAVSYPQGVEIDLGGIAKGYTSDRVKAIAKEMGVESALLNLGGNMQTLGCKPDGDGWNIAIADPDDGSQVLGAVCISKDEAVVTSGGYERNFEENGVTYHHIIDPSTGYPAYNGLASVSIISSDATLADGLSTALYVMGTDAAISYYKEHADEFECVLYTDEGELYISPGLEKTFQSNLIINVIS